MSLLAELKKKLNAVYDRIDSLKAESDALDDEAYDLDVACRALEEDELYATKDLDEPLEPAEALLDPQPEAASPEFASEQGEAHDETWTPPPGYTYIPTQAVRCRCDYLVTDTIGNYFCCNQRNDERTSVVTDQDRVEPQIPEGFTPWSGGECPVPGQSVEYLCAADDVPVKTDRPEDWTWRHEGIPSRARIIAYRIIQPSAEAERIEDVSEPLATIEQTLITDDIPSIPREEIPIGAAVETYTDSGIETVKLAGTTYVVDDEPVAEASYAPVNNEPASDALMWANGFEADARAKAEPEQDKRPFWTRAPKPKKELA